MAWRRSLMMVKVNIDTPNCGLCLCGRLFQAVAALLEFSLKMGDYCFLICFLFNLSLIVPFLVFNMLLFFVVVCWGVCVCGMSFCITVVVTVGVFFRFLSLYMRVGVIVKIINHFKSIHTIWFNIPYLYLNNIIIKKLKKRKQRQPLQMTYLPLGKPCSHFLPGGIEIDIFNRQRSFHKIGSDSCPSHDL